MTAEALRRRAMLVHAGALGDFVLSLRVVEALRGSGLDGITLLGRSAYAELARCAGIERLIDFETGGFHALYGDGLHLPKNASAHLAGHALVVDMTGGDKTFVSRLRAATGGLVIGVDPRPAAASTEHITDQWLSHLKQAGIPVPGIRAPRIIIPTRPARSRREVMIHPGSGGPSKCWPIERFVELASRLSASDVSIRFIVGPAESDRWPANAFDRLATVGPIVKPMRLVELGESLAAARYYVGNDSGVTHLAAAVGTPVTAIFGPTEPRVWRPLGEHVSVLGGGTWPETSNVAADVVTRLDLLACAG